MGDPFAWRSCHGRAPEDGEEHWSKYGAGMSLQVVWLCGLRATAEKELWFDSDVIDPTL